MLAAELRSGCAIVTGGSSGVGAALVSQLLRTPCIDKVYVTGQRLWSETPLNRQLQSESDLERVKYSSGDTGDDAVVSKQYNEALSWFGKPPSAIFLNAGIGGGRVDLESLSIDRFDAMFHVNVRGPYLWLHHALPALKSTSSPSQVVVTSSVAALRGIAQGGPYCATKWAVNGLVLSLREELKMSAPHVKVGLICPGPIDTEWFDDPARGGRPKDMPKPPSMLTPEAVAKACVQLMLQDVSSNIENVVMEPSTVGVAK